MVWIVRREAETLLLVDPSIEHLLAIVINCVSAVNARISVVIVFCSFLQSPLVSCHLWRSLLVFNSPL